MNDTEYDTPETDSKWDTLLISGTPWRYMAESMLEACGDMERERNEARKLAARYRNCAAEEEDLVIDLPWETKISNEV